MRRAAPAESADCGREPRWMDGFLSERTCGVVLEELEVAFWRGSSVVRRRRDGSLETCDSVRRVSETADEEWFSPRLRRELRKIEARVAAMLHVDVTRFEPWQATRYRRGGRFDFHLDAGYWAGDPAGDREKTVLVYLDTPGRGGATRFQELGLDVDARAGRLLTWDNLLADERSNARMLHAAAPVFRGVKTVLVTWIRQRGIRKSREEALDGRRKGGRPKDHPEIRFGHRSGVQSRGHDRDPEEVSIRR